MHARWAGTFFRRTAAQQGAQVPCSRERSVTIEKNSLRQKLQEALPLPPKLRCAPSKIAQAIRESAAMRPPKTTALAAVRAALARPPKLRCAPSKIAGAGIGAFAAEPISEGRIAAFYPGTVWTDADLVLEADVDDAHASPPRFLARALHILTSTSTSTSIPPHTYASTIGGQRLLAARHRGRRRPARRR